MLWGTFEELLKRQLDQFTAGRQEYLDTGKLSDLLKQLDKHVVHGNHVSHRVWFVCQHGSMEHLVHSLSPRKYSEFITFPIELFNEKVQYDQVPDESAPPPKEGEKQKMKSVPRSVYEWDIMNKMKPIWLRNPDVVNESEYTEFYKTTFKAGPNRFFGDAQVL